jgi:hypothetical protein
MAQRSDDDPAPGPDNPAPAPTADLPSPIPRRSAAAQQKLTVELLNLDTFAERLTYLFEQASTYYLLNNVPVIDPDEIDRFSAEEADRAATREVDRKAGRRPGHKPGSTMFLNLSARPPMVAEWVRARTGLPLAEQALRNFKAGVRQNSRPAITRALAEFWRIHPNLLDPSVPASDFAPPDDEVARKTHELVTELGLVGFNARDITSSIGDAPEAAREQLLQVVEQIARTRRAAREDPAS